MGCRSKKANWSNGEFHRNFTQGLDKWEKQASRLSDTATAGYIAQVRRNLEEKQSRRPLKVMPVMPEKVVVGKVHGQTFIEKVKETVAPVMKGFAKMFRRFQSA